MCSVNTAMLIAEEKMPSMQVHQRRLWPYLLGGALFVLLGAWVALAIVAKQIEPYLKERVVRDLSERFDGSVEIGTFHVTVAPTLRINGENLVMRNAANGADPPLLSLIPI